MEQGATHVGIGYDVHAFAPADAGRGLIIGGVPIAHTRGLAGHSDADVLIHALVDAFLGAAALGDIGTHFPSSAPRWRDVSSGAFLRQALVLLAAHGWRPVNADATVVAQQPRLTPYVAAMRASLATTLHLPLAAVSVKTKTTDGLGFTGRAEGIACYAVVLIERIAPEGLDIAGGD